MSYTQATETDAQDTDRISDPSRVIPPYIDTSIKWGEFALRELVMFAPGAALLVVVSPALLLLGAGDLLWLVVPAGFAFLFAGFAINVVSSRFHSPLELAIGAAEYARLRGSLPWGHGDSADESVHGVRQFHPGGVAELEDGTYVAGVVVSPRNTFQLSEEDAERRAAEWSSAVDGDINDIPFTVFSTTREPDEDVSERYAERATAPDDEFGERPERAREHLYDVAGWLDEVDRPAWEPRATRHVVLTRVDPHEVESTTSLFSFGDSRPDRHDAMVETVTDRRDTLREAIGAVEGVTARDLSIRTHADFLLRYWTGESHDPDEHLVGSFRRGDYPRAGGPTPAQTMLAPGLYDVEGGTVRMGDRYSRTLWIAGWPVAPDPLFLRRLYTRRGVDIDVAIHARPESSRDVQAELKDTIAEIDAEGMERAENADPSAMDVDSDIDAYIKMYQLLRTTSTQPWQVSAYVTVHANDRDELEESVDDVRRVIETGPTDAFAITPGLRQADAHRSGAPTPDDPYSDGARVPKTTRMLGGALGAMFPFCSPALTEESGLDWGRNKTNGTLLKADPFRRGVAPHLLTIGQSRSGKTYSVGRSVGRWYRERSDRTLIVCDTQSGFDGLTKLLDGEHIVIDGQQTINPLDIQPVPEHVLRSAGGEVSPYAMKIDEAQTFIAGILRAQGIDPGPFNSTIEEALQETYARQGITSDPETHSNESPTVRDFLDTLIDILENPEEYTHGGHEAETEPKVERVSDLLDFLSGFREGGKYEHMVGATQHGIDATGGEMVYLDLQQLQGQSDAERSVMLHLMLGQVYEVVKRNPDETIFVLDEAHFLFHSDEMVDWLQKAAREWARYDAAMWFVSQSPREFIQRSAGTDVGQENQRRTIVDQCSTIQFFRTPRVQPDILRQFGLNDRQIATVRDDLTPGKSGRGYSECLLSFEDRRGWWPAWVEAAPFEDAVLNYTPREHGDFEEYLREVWGEIDAW